MDHQRIYTLHTIFSVCAITTTLLSLDAAHGEASDVNICRSGDVVAAAPAREASKVQAASAVACVEDGIGEGYIFGPHLIGCHHPLNQPGLLEGGGVVLLVVVSLSRRGRGGRAEAEV